MTSPTAAVIAADPTADGVLVTIPSLDGGERRHGPCVGYQPHGAVDAQRGDLALVVEDNTGRLWIVAWEAA